MANANSSRATERETEMTFKRFGGALAQLLIGLTFLVGHFGGVEILTVGSQEPPAWLSQPAVLVFFVLLVIPFFSFVLFGAMGVLSRKIFEKVISIIEHSGRKPSGLFGFHRILSRINRLLFLNKLGWLFLNWFFPGLLTKKQFDCWQGVEPTK